VSKSPTKRARKTITKASTAQSTAVASVSKKTVKSPKTTLTKAPRAPSQAQKVTPPEPQTRESIIFSFANLKANGSKLLRGAGELTLQAASTSRVLLAFVPLTRMVARESHITQTEFSDELDKIFKALYDHPLTERTRKITSFLRSRNVLPNEVSTEGLIHYVVKEAVARSPMPVPQQIIDEFWTFFHELMSEPELSGLADLGLDISRLLLKTYEPLIVDVINEIKDIFYTNQNRMDALLFRVQIVRQDLKIIRRQIKALRYIRPFLQTDPKDFKSQAQIVAQMVREFGPFFIKMAQVAAATADFLPEEIARELAVFQEDVPPMSSEEARYALIESLGKPPEEIYFGFDANKPLKSGSIGSVYLAKKPILINNVEHLIPVVIKIGRHNLDREFLMGKTSIGLMVLSSQYWAPHGKLTPFLKAMTDQIDVFIEGFRGELQFQKEAAIQSRFSKRAKNSQLWSVPEVYSSTERVIEMEYVEGAVSILKACTIFHPRDKDAYQRLLAKKLLYIILTQIFIYQEIHGDLHPGNIMVDKDNHIHIIDWGNTIHLAGKVVPVLNYIKGALVADPDAMTDALIKLSTDPDSAFLRRNEIKDALIKTLSKKDISPLSYDFIPVLTREGPEGWLKRANTLLQLMSNTQQLGIVIRSEYLHLSRSFGAMIGTLGSLYKDIPRHAAVLDIAVIVYTFPARLLQDFLFSKKSEIKDLIIALARRAVFAAPK
jgi:ubiquinone biosynthesis protein